MRIKGVNDRVATCQGLELIVKEEGLCRLSSQGKTKSRKYQLNKVVKFDRSELQKDKRIQMQYKTSFSVMYHL